jgi:hypothetical protein
MNRSESFRTGRRRPRFLNSMPKRTVAADCRKNSTPPVARSWLMGAAPSSGAITSTCSKIPSTPTITMETRAAARKGSRYAVYRKYMPYMPTMMSSA